ncbi:MAG: 4Fe-4S dicluster domain-containing protein, partial [Xanthobacteraceae bacterium]
MAEQTRKILICSCERTMPLDEEAVEHGCGEATLVTANELCRGELDIFRTNAEGHQPLLIGCTQEAPLFSELAHGRTGEMAFANIRETAGWSKDAGASGPKMAALLAAAAEPVPDIPFVSFKSDGVILIYGRDEQAIPAGALLKDDLDVTVLIKPPAAPAPPSVTDFPVVQGRIRTATGHLGAFKLIVDAYAQPSPSSRDVFRFGLPRDGATSQCDLVLDLSGDPSLFPAGDLRDGYLRADPGDPAGVLRAVLKARDLTGTFDKPRYISFTADICAHSRSKIVGCARCLDLCPTGAIAPAGNHVAIDPYVCAGCGQCAAVCPTGAAAYALPPADVLLRKWRVLLAAYRNAGGVAPVLLVHDEAHGTPLIHALARFGDGLPANVLPLAVNEVTQIGLEAIAAAFAYGASAMRLLLRAKPRHDVTGLVKMLALAEPILVGLGFGSGRIGTIETDDPESLGEALRSFDLAQAVAEPASFMPVGAKRDVLRLALRELHRVAPAPVDIIALPAGAPFGAIEIDVAGCTLCLACVSACPTGALSDNPEKPMLRFTEDACVQCGLCKATCPEKVITLTPRLDFRAATATARFLYVEEPFHCIRCGMAFGVKSTIERIAGKLADKHWMFQGSRERLEVIKMCEDCRVITITEQ